MARRTVTILAAAALSLAAGCGGGDQLSKDAYEQELSSVGNRLESSSNELQKAFEGARSAGSLEEAADEIGALQEDIREEAESLEEVEPPDDAEKEHQQIVEGMNAFADDLEEFRDAVEEGDVRAIQEFGEELPESEGFRKLDEATQSLEKKGYEFEE